MESRGYAHVPALLGAARAVAAATILAAAVAGAAPLGAQEQGHEAASSHDHGVHFSHPIITESVSPDTKVRLDYEALRLDAGDGGTEWTNGVAFEAEYALHRSFSVEARLPYLPDEGKVGELHVGLKFANYAFEEWGLLLGYGLNLGLPTGEHAGTAHGHDDETGGHSEASRSSSSTGADAEEDVYEIEPFLNVGLSSGRWELVAFSVFSIPTNQEEQDEVGTGWLYDISALFHASDGLQLLLEYGGETGASGPEAGETRASLSPGVKVRPSDEWSLQLGAATSFPVVGETGFDPRVRLSAFWHF